MARWARNSRSVTTLNTYAGEQSQSHSHEFRAHIDNTSSFAEPTRDTPPSGGTNNTTHAWLRCELMMHLNSAAS
eukprot:14698496-Alexandrium_andersonii.AAC.1